MSVYSVTEAARWAQVSREVIYNSIRNRTLRATKRMFRWQIAARDLDRWASQRLTETCRCGGV